MTWQLLLGDCIEVMAEMDEASVDAIVTDPPYGLGFMGREWDDLPPGPVVAAAMLRVLKPGGHLLSFGGTRTYHRLVCALEDAGFEIRDCLAWLYGSGFPKSLDVSKAIDKAAGAEREVYAVQERTPREPPGATFAQADKAERFVYSHPGSPDAERWQGWGTALKPAFEPIVLARKPLAERNVAANVLEHGTGALNVDGTRIPSDDGYEKAWDKPVNVSAHGPVGHLAGPERKIVDLSGTKPSGGRWPANVLLDPEAAAMLDDQSGERGGGVVKPYQRASHDYYSGSWPDSDGGGYPDSGGASRFFYTAKTSRSERERGVRDYGEGEPVESPGSWGSIQEWSANPPARNHHPTVKPVDLMQWLCRLVTPPGGTVLDPFTGSGSTGMAALREGFSFIGIEREPEYVEIARARIIGDGPLFAVGEEVTA